MDERRKIPANLLQSTVLPQKSLDGCWHDIVVHEKVKKALFSYVKTIRKFHALSLTLCAIYRFALLYGRPGTGKTSLAKGVANEVATEELSETGKSSELIRMNLGCMFSENLGETPRWIGEAFQAIRMAARQKPVYVLLDDAESLLTERGSLGKGDPSDVLRTVNSVLTEIDSSRSCDGIVILATSNFPRAIDGALWDRIDLKLCIRTPTKEVARTILQRSGQELQKVGVTVGAAFVARVVDELYNGNRSLGLSGRDLSRLLALTAALKGGHLGTAGDVVRVARMLMNREI
jgi:SpoVK/Ycf46/Vps4 family AAA+-type ATPase